MNSGNKDICSDKNKGDGIISKTDEQPRVAAIAENGDPFSLSVTNVCKGIAIILLLAHHLWQPSQPGQYPDWLRQFAINGKWCVSLFLVLSGYGLYKSGCGWIKTFVYRLPHMLINYWVVGLIFIPISILVFGQTLSRVYPHGKEWVFALQAFGVNWIMPTRGFNPTWWFMNVIVPLYLMSPILFWIAKRNPFLLLMFSILAMILPIKSSFWSVVKPWQLSFIYGMLLCELDAFGRMRNRTNAILSCVLGIAGVCLAYAYRNSHLDYVGAIFIMLTTCALFALFGKCAKMAFLPLEFIGIHSMNIFLIHTFFRYCWFKKFFDLQAPFVTFPLLLAASLLSSVAIEQMKRWIGLGKLFALLKRVGSARTREKWYNNVLTLDKKNRVYK